MCHMRRRIHLYGSTASALCLCILCHMRRRIHVSYEEEDTFVRQYGVGTVLMNTLPYEEEDTCVI